MGRRLRKSLTLAVKLAVTGGVLWWVLSGVHWRDYAVTPRGRSVRVLDRRDGRLLVTTPEGPAWRGAEEFQQVQGQVVRPGIERVLSRLHPWLYASAAALIACQLTLMGVRWWYLLRFQQVPLGLGAVVRIMFVGHFFNFFLPGSTGGDLVRAYLVTRRTARRTVAVATVLLDRFVGLSGMALLAGAMTLATWGDPRTQRAAAAVGVTVAVLLAAGAVLFSRTVAKLLRLDRLIDRLPRRQNFRIAVDTLQRLPRSPRAAAVVGAMTVGVHLLLAAAVACMGRALGLPAEWHLYFLFVPVIYILAAVPVSIGGLGVVEGLYVLFLAAGTDADRSPILALALLARVTPMVLALPGLIFWLAERSRRGPRPGGGPGRTAQPGDTT